MKVPSNLKFNAFTEKKKTTYFITECQFKIKHIHFGMKISMAIISNRSRPYQLQLSVYLMLHSSLQDMESKSIAFSYTRNIFPATKLFKAISKLSFSLLIKGSKWNVRWNENTDVANIWSSLLRAYLKAVASRGTALRHPRFLLLGKTTTLLQGTGKKISWALKTTILLPFPPNPVVKLKEHQEELRARTSLLHPHPTSL